MAETTIPTLSRVGFNNSPSAILSKQFEYFLISEYSQSNLYRGKIASLKWILANNDKPVDVKTNLSKYITTMYENYFDNVNVIIDLTDSDTSTLYNINVVVTIDDKEYSLLTELNISGNTINNLKEAIERLYV